jgi:hypothetical protein
MRKRTNAFALILIALLVPALFFAGGYSKGEVSAGLFSIPTHVKLGNFDIGTHFQGQLTYSLNVQKQVYQPADLGAYQITYGVANAPRVNLGSMFSDGYYLNIPRRTLPNGPVRYYNVGIPVRHMDGYWDP